MLKAAAYYAVPPADGWTSFEEGAKSPSAALSALKLGGSGVGHCAFTTDQTVAAVKVWRHSRSEVRQGGGRGQAPRLQGARDQSGPAVRAAGLEEPCRHRRLERTTPEGGRSTRIGPPRTFLGASRCRPSGCRPCCCDPG